MSLLGGRTLVAFDRSGLLGVVLERSLRGLHVRSHERIPLEAGALEPSPTEVNPRQPGLVRAALQELASRLGGPSRITLVLPLGLARMALLDPPAGTAARDFAHFRLGPTLPFPADEAIVDTLSAGGARVVGAAVRREVVAGYEELAAACGLLVERVDIAPFPAIVARLQDKPAAAVDVFLGDAAFAVAAHTDGRLLALYTRFRAAGSGEARRIARVVETAARVLPGPVAPRVLVLGTSSQDVAGGLAGLGQLASSGPELALVGAAA